MSRTLLSLVVTLFLATLAAEPALANGILLEGDGAVEPSRRAHRVRLIAHTVNATVTDGVADVTVEQVFRSDARRQLEGTYVFPLPEGATVSDFAMTMGGTMVKGEVVEAKQARAIYEGIVRRRKDPGLLEYVGRDMFRARVFPILPDEDMTIRLSFQQVLRDDAGTLRFRYPLATDRLNGQAVDRVSVTVDVTSSVDLKAIYSPSHRVAITREGERKATATLVSRDGRQREDFVLYASRSPGDVGFSLLSGREPAKDGTFMAVIAPRGRVEADEQLPRDVIFVLDTSGSMKGEKIEQARRALAYGVNSLGPDDRFNILAFSTTTRGFRETLVPAEGAVRKAALDWIAGLDAGGGTAIHAALTEAVAQARSKRRCMVVFLTDGKPSVGVKDPTTILADVARANRAKARVFTFGVGSDLDVRFLDRIAEGTGGARDYVAPREDIELVTGRFFQKVSQLVLTDLALELGDGVYDVYPRELPDLFAGSQLVVFGRYREGGARTIALTGTLGERTMRYEHAAHLAETPGPDHLERLWAHRKVAFLLDELRLHGRNQELIDEVVALGTKHAIVTPYTSGLVIEDEEVAEQVETDNDLPFDESRGGRRGHADAPFEGPASHGSIGIGGGAGGAFKGRGGSRNVGTGGAVGRRGDALEDALRWLAAHQSPTGSWSSDAYDRWVDRQPSSPWDTQGARGAQGRDLHVTAQATLAFLAAGYTNRGNHPFAEVVGRALRYLKNVQDPAGCFGSRTAPEWMLAHARAATAMVEAYGMTGSPIFKGSAQRALDFLALARTPGGLWGRQIKAAETDLAVSTWAATAYLTGNLVNQAALGSGRRPPLAMQPGFLGDLRGFLAAVPATQDRAKAARLAWLWILAYGAGEPGKPAATLAAFAKAFTPTTPHGFDAGDAEVFAALSADQIGGETWRAWRRLVRGSVDDGVGVFAQQVRVGAYERDHGSWAVDGDPDGRVGVTARLARRLSTDYDYDRKLRYRELPVDMQRLGGAAGSQALKRLKEAASSAEVGGSGARVVDGKTFRLDGAGRWVDTAWDGKATPKPVEAMSEAWFALAQRDAATARQLALGHRMVIVIEGVPYEITPAP